MIVVLAVMFVSVAVVVVVVTPDQPLKKRLVNAGAVADSVPPEGTRQLPAVQAEPVVVEVGVIRVTVDIAPFTVTLTVTVKTALHAPAPSQAIPVPQETPAPLLPDAVHTGPPDAHENTPVLQG